MTRTEKFIAYAPPVLHVLALGLSVFTEWSLSGILWLIKLEAFGAIGLSIYTIFKDWVRQSDIEVIPSTFLALGTLSLIASLWPVPPGGIWILFALHSVVSAFLSFLLLFFPKRLN
ncbi:hypothetical protein [Kiloniella laminariae]|uniref:hypothetical protein n=1 Tax=Kiloniella laminariae TaxID=454162 RepID=UPI00037EE8AC|nr:hypothetical protein [Kiloniella laminariae]